MKETCRRVVDFNQVRTAIILFVLPTAMVVATVRAAGTTSPTLRVSSIQSNGWVRIFAQGATSNAVVTLESSSDLLHWEAIAVLHDEYPHDEEYRFTFADPVSPELPTRFYRFKEAGRVHADDWKNQIAFRDSFVSAEHGQWVKFTILLDDPVRVYYADGSQYLFHYDFATNRLDSLVGVEYEDFQRMALYNEGRQVLLGAVIFPPPTLDTREYGVQFVSEDPLPRELVRDLFHLVRSTVSTSYSGPAENYPDGSFYMPSFEQRAVAEADRAWFETNGVLIASPDRWMAENTCYSTGWALGTLKFFPANEIDAAYGDGRLLPTDILLTDAVPSELPYVAGIITLSAATPNSHVAILALSHAVPFVHLVDQTTRARAIQLVGRDVAFRVTPRDEELARTHGWAPSCNVDLVLLEPPLDAALRGEILAGKSTPPINLAPIAHFGGYTAPVDNLLPADIHFFGGKAANYGLLRRTIPSNSPPAIAISFDLWQEFMAQTLANGNTLRQEISNRLAGYTYPQRIAAIKTTLASIRALIRQETHFTPAQEQAIIAALRVFDSRRNIRFRSSTNVEDTETFSGAGLYDSYSGCLDDDLDGEAMGPSHCDPSENDERGVFRAMRRVYASFYNDNAFLERARRNVDEQVVGMAMLVHHSTPDEFEMANGVATAHEYESPDSGGFNASLVSQLGAVSVTNPDGSADPEQVVLYRPWQSNEFERDSFQPSSLVPAGEYVMDWPSDYRELVELLTRVSSAYRVMTGKDTINLDFEYKKVQPGRLEIKQVRPIPSGQPDDSGQYLLDEPVTFVPRQSLNSGIFQAHRLKSKWTFRTTNRRLNETNMIPVHSALTIEHLNGGRVETFTAPVDPCQCWRMASLAGPVDVFSYLSLFPPPSRLLFLRDFQFTVRATNQQSQIYARPGGYGLASTNIDVIHLIVDVPPRPDDQRYQWTYRFTNAPPLSATIQTSYQLDRMGALVGNMQTRLEGLTTQPVVLTNFYSQTLGLLHHNAARHFLFEPRLEPGLTPQQSDELAARDIRLIYVRDMFGASTWQVWGE